MNIPGRKIFHGESVYSDWMPRGGDDAIFRAEVIEIEPDTGDLELVVEFYTKNRDATSSHDGVPIEQSGSSSSIKFGLSSLGVSSELIESGTAANKGILELVRYKITTSAGAAGDFINVRMFPPIFFDRAT